MKTEKSTYAGLEFSTSPVVVLFWVKPYCLFSMHLSTEAFVENKWIDAFELQHASMFSVGWNTIEVIVAF